MADIIYNQFLTKLAGEGVDLSRTNEYKICLLRSDVLNKVLEPEFGGDYTLITQSGWECRDLIPPTDDLIGYHKGGKFINLVRRDQSSYTEYYSTDIIFRNVTLKGEDAARYALLYRVFDGLLVSLFDLGRRIEVDDDSFILDWNNVAVVRIGSVDPSSIYIDNKFSPNSENAVQNKVLTEALKRYGIILDGDPIPDPENPEDPFGPLDGMDEREKITTTSIDEMFNTSTGNNESGTEGE